MFNESFAKVSVVSTWSDDPSVVRVVTHDGLFHADDLFAVGAISASTPNEVEVMRTRDPAILAAALADSGTWVVDVGKVYDPAMRNLDHHQDGAPVRPDGTPYSGFGLVEHHLGMGLSDFSRHVDAIDNGVKNPPPAPAFWSDIFGTGVEGSVNYVVHKASPVHVDGSPSTTEEMDVAFALLANGAAWFLQGSREPLVSMLKAGVAHAAKAYAASAERVKAAVAANGQAPVLALDRYEAAAVDTLGELPADHPLKFFVFPAIGGKWNVQQIATAPKSFAGRKALPAAWAGLDGAALAGITGVADCVFCHKGRFIAGAKTREGALALAALAVAAE